MRPWNQIIAAVHVALFLYYLRATIIVEPFWDMYAHVLRYLDFREGGTWWAYLWEPHVQHRHVWIRLLTALDVEAFSGVALPFIVSSACAMAMAAWLLWRESRRIDPSELGAAVGCLAVMLVLTSVGAVVCAIPMNGVYPQVLVFTVLALTLFEGPWESERGTPRLPWRRLAALLAAMCAAFANAAALSLWPILGWMAWRGRAGRAWTIGVLLLGAAFAAFYLRGLPLAPEGGGPSGLTAPDRLSRMAEYLLTYMGLPWTRAAALEVPGRIIGGALLLIGVWAVLWRGFIRPRGGRLERLALGCIMFSFASALLASVGRVDVGPELVVPVRYSLFLMPLHAGMLWLASPYLSRQWAIQSRRPAIQALMIGASLLLVVQQVAAGQAAVETTRSMRATIQRFMAGEEDPAAARVVFDDLEEARDASDRIQAAGLYTAGGP